MREALRALAETGLVRIEKNRGVFVREISVAEADEIYELRATLDQMAGQEARAVDPPSSSPSCAPWSSGCRTRRSATTVEGYHLANLRFHDALVEFAGNAKLLQMYRRLVNELSLFRRHTLAEPRPPAQVDAASTRRSSP